MATSTPKELALQFETDARTVRKFLRDVTPVEDHPGKGSRWAIENRTIRSLTKKFTEWEAARAAAEAAEDDTPSDA